VSATHGRVTDLDGVDDVVGLGAGFATIADPVVYLVDVLTLPPLTFVKLLHDGLADRLAAHIHRDEAGCEEGAVLVAVDLLKDEAQHGGVDEGFVVLLNVFRSLRTEIVGIEKFEEIGQRGELAGHFFALLVLQHGIGQDGQDLFVLQIGDKQRNLFDVRGFEEGAVEIGHLFKDPDHIGIALVVTACQYLKKQAVEVVEVFDLVHIEKGVRLIPLMVGDQLRLQELQKQNTVDPRDTQFQRDIEEAFLRVGAKLAGPLQPAQLIEAVQLDDGVLEQTTGITCLRLVPFDDLFATFLGLCEADDVEEFAVESFVEAIAVVGKWQLEQMFGREQFKEGDEHIVILAVIIAQRLLIVLNVEIRKYNISLQCRHERLSDLLVEKVCIRARQSPCFEVLKLLYQLFILCKQRFKQDHIEYVPLIDVGDDEVFYFEVFVGNTFAEVVEDEFVEGLGIQFLWRHHLRLIGWFLRFYDDPDTRRCNRPIVYDQVISPFGIDEMILFIIRILQKVRHEIFVKLFGFVVVGGVEELYQIALERFYVNAVWFDLEEGFVEGEAGGEGGKGHGGSRIGFLKGGGKYGKKC